MVMDNNKLEFPTEDDSTVNSPTEGQDLQGNAQIEDQELIPLALNAKRLPFYIKQANKLKTYLADDKKKLTLKYALSAIGFLLLLFSLNRFSFDFWSAPEKQVTYNSFSSYIPNIKTWTRPFFDIQFENPTPYHDIKKPKTSRGDYIPRLHMTCHLYSKDHLNIIIRDADKQRYELPHEAPFPFPKDVKSVLPEDSDFLMTFQFDPFDIIIMRKTTGEAIFRLTDRFVFTNLYMEISFILPTHEIYGLGERISPLQFKSGTYTTYTVDRIGQIDPGHSGFNTQGHHSMYLNKEISGFYHINLIKNISPQEVVIKDRKVTWKAIAGVYDFHFFLGDSAEDVTQKYHTYLGGWTMPAFWHMGYQQSKWWGYRNLSHMEAIVANFSKFDLPLDVIWSDLDIYKDSQNFKFDSESFPFAETREMLKKHKKKWIPVVQAYIPSQSDNPAWQHGEKEEILDLTIKNGITHAPLIGRAFSGLMHFIDFLHPKAKDFWKSMLGYIDNQLPISGIWLDANELTNLMRNWRDSKELFMQDVEKHKYYDLPFYPGTENFYNGGIVELDALHYGDVEEINVRSLTCFHQAFHTYEYLKSRDGTYFPFVLSRGNMFGMGQFSFHFVPDVTSSWELMRASLGPVLTYQIFGIPMIGADVCGFVGWGPTTPELCARWHQLSVFYTFARNHHAPLRPEPEAHNYQEPYLFSGVYFDTIKKHMLLRYSLLKQFYTFFFKMPGTEFRVGTIIKPLFFEFQDHNMPPYGSYVYEEQFMLSDTVMAAPVLYEGRTEQSIYFPNCKWFDLRNGNKIPVHNGYFTLPTPIEDEVPYFLREGKILLKQEVRGIRSTEDLTNVFKLTAGLPDFHPDGNLKKSRAVGNILDIPNYSEEVVYKHCVEKNCLMNITVNCSYDSHEFSVTVSSTSQSEPRTENHVEISEINLLGVPDGLLPTIGKAELKGSIEKSAYEYVFTSSNQVLSISISDGLILLDNNVTYIFSIKI